MNEFSYSLLESLQRVLPGSGAVCESSDSGICSPLNGGPATAAFGYTLNRKMIACPVNGDHYWQEVTPNLGPLTEDAGME